MFQALFTAASGLRGQQSHIDVIANNLANVNTNGFKASQLNFQDLLYHQEAAAGSESTEGYQMPTGLEIGSGVRVASSTNFSQGPLEETGGSFDVAIQGGGFMRVQMADGTTAYTRDGSLGIDGQRRLVISDGRPLADNASMPNDFTSVHISADGNISVMTPGSPDPQAVGSMTLATFANPAGLKSVGDNLYVATAASGAPTTATPGQNGAGTIRHRYLERSNVNVVTELVRMIQAQRAYEINTKAINIADKMLQNANNLVR